MQWTPASFETWTCHLRMNLAGFHLSKVHKKNILCLVDVSKPLKTAMSAVGSRQAELNEVTYA